LNRFLHNDKLMMLVSLLLAFVIWALVVFGPSNTQERVITGVPISTTLNDYASETLNLQITSGADATATVKVRGLRSVVGRLSASDITIIADTGNVIKEGTYTLPLRVTSRGDYTIVSVAGPDGNNDSVTISCDAWREARLPVSVEMSKLTVTDSKNYQIGTAVVSNAVLKDGLITLSGPRTDINRIDKVVAVISEEDAISETAVYTASLQARDANGQVINSVKFVNAEDGKVSVVVPVLVYREVDLKPIPVHVPAGFADQTNLVTVSPSKLELWGDPKEIDDYINSVKQKLTVDFDHLTPDDSNTISLDSIPIKPTGSIRLLNGEESLALKMNLSGIIQKEFKVTLSSANFTVNGLADGYTVTTKQTVSVKLCGRAQVINSLRASDIRLIATVTQTTEGSHMLTARVEVPNKTGVWAFYDDGTAGKSVSVEIKK
jgi:YbbR domain-containing protein